MLRYIAVVGLIVSSFLSAPAYAKVSCFCTVECSFGDGSTFGDSKAFWKRPNGRNFNQPVSGNESNECQSYCNDFMGGFNFAQMAKERKACGPYSCKGTSKVGNSNRSIRNLSQSGEYQCPVVVEEPPVDPVEYQYSTKYMCGKSDRVRITLGGEYQTAVNLHNPSYENVKFRWKVATAGFAQDGAVSDFRHGVIGADGVQVFDCKEMESQMPSATLHDGYFVVESKQPLDVVAYYTGGDGEKLVSLDVERTSEREVPEKRWICDGSDAVIDLSDPSVWRVASTPAAHISGNTTPAGAGWDVSRDWISVNAGGGGGAGITRFEVPLCNCKRKTRAKVEIQSARVDDRAKFYFAPLASSTSINLPIGNLGGQTAQHPLAQNLSPINGSLVQGDNFFVAEITNTIGPFGMSLEGATLTIEDGYYGKCE